MTAVPASAVYNATHDPVYDILQKQIAVDADTQRKASRKITASSNGSGAVGSAATILNGKRTEFQFSNGTNYKLRWDTTRLNVTVVFASSTVGNATALDCSPPWNLLGSLISEMTLTFNGSGSPIYTKANGQFKPCFTSRLLRHYTLEQLNKMDDFIFTPVDGDSAYIYDSASDLGYRVSTAVVHTDTTQKYAYPTYAAGTEAFVGTDLNGFHGAHERYKRWCNQGTGSHLMKHVISIPFADLFPRFQGVPKNLRSVGLSIEWNSATALMEECSSTSAGAVCIIGADIVTDDYIMSAGQSMESINDKMKAEPDIIGFIDTDCQKFVWTGADIIKPSVRNLDSVMIMQFADDVALNLSGGKAYTSSGQFMLCNGEAETANTYFRTRSDIVDTDIKSGPKSLQIQYGDVFYPPSPITLTVGDYLNTTELYFEFLKATGKVSDRLNGAPLPKWLFSSTMPFALLKPWSGNAGKLSDARDLVVSMPEYETLVGGANKTDQIWVICNVLKTVKIAVDGTVSVSY